MRHNYHYYRYVFGADADYIVLESLERRGDNAVWIEHARWMIPGTLLED